MNHYQLSLYAHCGWTHILSYLLDSFNSFNTTDVLQYNYCFVNFFVTELDTFLDMLLVSISKNTYSTNVIFIKQTRKY